MDQLVSHELFISNLIGQVEFGELVICTDITFYRARKLYYTTLVPYLDNTVCEETWLNIIKIFIFVTFGPNREIE